jgi:predicted nucleic acid-binding protein
MIVVVADTSPLNYLVQIDCQELLAALYERVLVPPAVIAELDHPATPAAVRTWLAHRPDWIVIEQLQSPSDTPQALPELDPGEREAIQLALEAHADLVLMDEKLGVRLARQRGLRVIGTLGVLVQGAKQGLVDINVAVERLQTTDFRCTPQLFEQVKQQVRAKHRNL